MIRSGFYAMALVQAALDSRGPSIRESNAMERFYRKYRWMFSSDEASWVEAAASVASWARIAYEVLQERRDVQGLPADPKRMGRHPSASGLGIRALMMPYYFMSRTFAKPRSRVVR